MKMLNDDGRFQFIKNGMVLLDKELPKFQAIKKYKELNKTAKIPPFDENGNLRQSVMTEEGYLGVKKEENVDELLRKKINELSSFDLQKYLLSDDAKEFNQKFGCILLGELNCNKSSLQIYNNNWDAVSYGEPYIDTNQHNLLKKLKNVISKLITGTKKTITSINEPLTVLKFFDLIHIETGKEKEFINRLDGYFSLIRNAQLMHQDAQVDELCQKIIINIYEAVLATHGFNKYVTFSNLESLKKDGGKVVDIDYIKNFGRIIPSDVTEIKLRCDNFHIFDNYCVMYYDPSGATYKRTTQARRDPILFGLINHSEKLYYIADWEDEYCNLTLDKVAESCQIEKIK